MMGPKGVCLVADPKGVCGGASLDPRLAPPSRRRGWVAGSCGLVSGVIPARLVLGRVCPAPPVLFLQQRIEYACIKDEMQRVDSTARRCRTQGVNGGTPDV